MNRVRSAFLAIALACAAGSAWAHPHDGGANLAAVGVDCAAPKDKAESALCAQWRTADAASSALIWSRVDIFLLLAALAFCAWAARSAARAAEAAKKEQSGGDRPFAFLIVHNVQYEPLVGGQQRPTLEGRRFKFAYVIKNYGRSACIVRRLSIGFAQAGALNQAIDKVEIVTNPSWVIPANGEEGDQVWREGAWTVEGMEAYRDGRETLFVSGEIQYEDLGGAQFVRRFCLTKGFEKDAAEEGGARANYDRRIYQDPQWSVAKSPPAPPKREPPPPKTWPPEEFPPDDGGFGTRVIPLKK